MQTYQLWQRYGVELEYMLVDAETLDIAPCADVVLGRLGIDEDGELDRGRTAWSNELANHVVELKTSQPVDSLGEVSGLLHDEIVWMAGKLREDGLALLPTAMHPWMDPARETVLWPLGNREVYEAYDRIFDCRGHGWSNLQSMHLNLSFDGDTEFGLLHAAVRLMLPLLPALCASSPIVEGSLTGSLDTRLDVYRGNQRRFPAITGEVIPEPVYSEYDYGARIYDAIGKAIAPHDPDGVLELHFLNSRGAIARFDRGAIEIRLMDVQECPRADAGIAEFVVACLKVFARCDRHSPEALQGAPVSVLARLLSDCQRGGMATPVADTELRALYNLSGSGGESVGGVLQGLFEEVAGDLSESAREVIAFILSHGNLAIRIIDALPVSFNRPDLQRVYRQLQDSLLHNRMFAP